MLLSLLPVVVALLYYLCFAFVLGLVGLIATSTSSNPPPTAAANLPWRPTLPAPVGRNGQKAERRLFFLLALSLLLWQLTLFLEARASLPALQLGLGRVNFAAVALAVFLAWRFVQEVAGSVSSPRVISFGPRIETALLTLVALLTPFVDEAESVVDGHPVTRFGPLFPLYLLHVLGYLVAALTLAFRARRRTGNRALRGRLTLIGGGILATGSIALVTNALLPYSFGDFRFCDVGTLSTLLFLLSVAYAVFVHGLFEVRLVLRATLVYGLLLALVLGAYSSAVFVATQYLTGATGADKLTQFVVLLLAFSFDPLRRFLEEKTDRLLFEQDKVRKRHRKQGGSSGRLIGAASLFTLRRD